MPKEGYFPIFANGGSTYVNGEHTVNSMKNLHGFCVYNLLPSGRIAKLQGGYYILNNDLKWEYIAPSLNSLPFQVLYNKLKNLK